MGSSADAARRRGHPRASRRSDNRSRGGRSAGAASAAPERRRCWSVGGIHGDEPASVEALMELACRLQAAAAPAAARARSGCSRRVNPDGVRGGSKNSARDVDLNRNFPGPLVRHRARARLFPRPAPRCRSRRPGCSPSCWRGSRRRGVVAVHAPFRLRQLRRSGRGLGRGGRGGVRLAGAGGHRLSHAGLAGELARGRPRPAGADAGAPARPAVQPFSAPRPRPPWTPAIRTAPV